MSRRSTPQKQIDERAFPVRLKISVPENGFGRQLDEIQRWLVTNIGPAEYATHPSGGIAVDALGLYLRDLDCADAFMAAFPTLTLADTTTSISYSSPALGATWSGWEIYGVCNLYSVTKGQAAMRDTTGNQPPLSGIYPDQMAPVVRNTTDGRELARLRWGMPSPELALKGKKVDRGVTNVRNTRSPHWRRWLGVENRCVVPFTSFAENDQRPGRNKELVWFALDESRPLAFFAGIWTTWTSVRKLKDGVTTDDLYAFLTTEPNDVVAPIHPKAMPVILRSVDEIEHWLTAEVAAALQLQRPLPDGTLEIVAKGPPEDSTARDSPDHGTQSMGG